LPVLLRLWRVEIRAKAQMHCGLPSGSHDNDVEFDWTALSSKVLPERF